jgi:hypothetical protein
MNSIRLERFRAKPVLARDTGWIPVRGARTPLKKVALGDDVRRDLVFDECDAVAQLQLALLQPLQPQ